jgi:HAE1 family hydrophobic/amphiphilic exporter-1
MFLSNISISKPVFTTMVILALVVFGYISYGRLGIDLTPDVDFGFLTITVVYPGADPETVESEIIDKIEEEVSTLPGIKQIQSRALENVGLVFMEYELDVDIDIAAQDVRARIESIKRDLPKDADSPIVEKLDVGAIPVMTVAVSADMPLSNLTTFVKDRIKSRFESIQGVGSVKMVGSREREVHVRLNPDAMRERNIGVNEVIGALKMSNIEIPGGRIETGTRELVVKTKGRVPAADEFGDIIIKQSPDGLVRLNDIADIDDTIEEKRSLARLDGKDAIGLIVRKKSGANTVKVAERINEEIIKLRNELPPGIEIEIPQDESIFIRASFEELLMHLFYGGLFAVLIVFLFLRSPRGTLISALAIPTSIIATFTFMNAMGFTLNVLSMLGLSLSVGMLIDNVIVVLENIYRHNEAGASKIDAARNGTTEIGLAVMATTFSIVAVFVPVAYTYGMIGRFLYEFGMTVSFAVLVSLFVSLTLTPMLASRFLVVTKSHGAFYTIIERGLDAMDRSYRELLRRALKHKWLTVLTAVVIFVFSIWIGSLLPLEFEPDMDEEQYCVQINTPPGSPISVIEKKIGEVEDIVNEIPGVETIFSSVGSGAIETVTEAIIQIALVPRHERDMHQREIIALSRKKLANITGGKLSVGATEHLSLQSGGDIQVSFQGENLDELLLASEKLVEAWKKEPGFVDVDMSYKSGKPEIRVLVNRDRASRLGLSVMGIASTVNGLVSGESVITSFKEAGQDYDVKVRLSESYRDDPMDLLAIPVRSMEGSLIDLGTVAHIEHGSGPSQITHKNRRKSVTVYANLDGLALGTAKDRTVEIIKPILPPTVSYSFEGLSDLMEESFQSLFFALALAVLLIYMLLASQFGHFIHPLSIMLSLPLSLIGALGALYLSGMTISIMTMLGIIMLMGLVTKNAILLVDYINTVRARGKSRENAILEAAPVRLRPIMMTTFAMVFGMLPVALGTGAGSEMQAPMAVCVIGGLLTSMFLTLIIVPVVYSMLDEFVERCAKLIGWK